MGREEKDLEKRKKLTDLQLDSEEWDRVKIFLDLLAVIPISQTYLCSHYILSMLTVHSRRSLQRLSQHSVS